MDNFEGVYHTKFPEMRRMKIAHEAPLAIMHDVQLVTDYDYALVHLFEESPEYYDFFVNAIREGREVILDNSIFELGHAFDSEKFYEYVRRLAPTWYIIPDVLNDRHGTVDSLRSFLEKYPKPQACKTIGVVQGSTISEVKKCYMEVAPLVDKIAFSFDSQAYHEFATGKEQNKYELYMRGRQMLLCEMAHAKVIDYDKPHHLLGAALPQEFSFYRYQNDLDCREFDGTYHIGFGWIDSVDTSNPVVAGLNGVTYKTSGLSDKIPTKLIEYMYDEVTPHQAMMIGHNIRTFRDIVGAR